MITKSIQKVLSKTLIAHDVYVDNNNLVLDGDKKIPIDRDVIKFRIDDGYNSNFSLQWKKFSKTQLDRENKSELTNQRFRKETNWNSSDLENKIVLEAGCGAGRFTCLLAKECGWLFSFDYSSAVEASAENNRQYNNTIFFQCDIFDMPFRDAVFDMVFCHGVLQHTPNPKIAFQKLTDVLKPGGRISVDVYLKDGKIRPWKSKYLWRPITTRISQERLLKFIEWYIPKWLPIHTKIIEKMPRIGYLIGSIIPCWNYHYTNLTDQQKLEWAILDTFDALGCVYDNPVTIKELNNWFKDCNYSEFEVREGGNGVVGNGTL